MKSTLERELKVREIAEREANETSSLQRDCYCLVGRRSLAPQGSAWRWKAKAVVLLVVKVNFSWVFGEIRGSFR